MNTLARYLSEVRKIRSLGSVPETSYYPPLSELLSTIGVGLSPRVRCVVHPKSQVAWRGIPADVWRYTIGGYQVMKKWLSYREQSVLGRALTTEEAREVRGMARRIAALLALSGELDANYEIAKRYTPTHHD